MQRFFMMAIASLIVAASGEARGTVEGTPPGNAAQVEGGAAVGRKQVKPSVAKGGAGQVEVRLDVLEAMERLQELRIKAPRWTSAAPGGEPAVIPQGRE
ncbi:MAG TPA: hypothetical protein VIU40_12995 [Geobacteraceae bacterium]